jgi:hypothetical protein
VYLALAPLTHAAGVLCFPVMALGGEVVVMPKPDLTEFLALIERHRVSHTFLPPTLIYMLLARQDVGRTELGSLRCFWYGAAPISAARLEDDDLDDAAGGSLPPRRVDRAGAAVVGRPAVPAGHRRRHGRRGAAAGDR